jgi:hypothetical protein
LKLTSTRYVFDYVFFSHLKSIVYQNYNRINMANVEFGQFWMSQYSWNTAK